jgi:hypothetical protein
MENLQEKTISLHKNIIKAVKSKVTVLKTRREVLLHKEDHLFKPNRPSAAFEEDADYIATIKDLSLASIDYQIAMLEAELDGRKADIEAMEADLNIKTPEE